MDHIEFYKGPFMPTASRNFKKVTEPHEILNACNRRSNGSTGGTDMSNNGKQIESAASKLDEDNDNGGPSADSSPPASDQRSAPDAVSNSEPKTGTASPRAPDTLNLTYPVVPTNPKVAGTSASTTDVKKSGATFLLPPQPLPEEVFLLPASQSRAECDSPVDHAITSILEPDHGQSDEVLDVQTPSEGSVEIMESPRSDATVTDIEDSNQWDIPQNAQVGNGTNFRASTGSWTSSHVTEDKMLGSISSITRLRMEVPETSSRGSVDDVDIRVAEQHPRRHPSLAPNLPCGPHPDDRPAHAHNCEHNLGQYKRASADLSIHPLWPTNTKLLVGIVHDLSDVSRLSQSASAWGICCSPEGSPGLSNVVVRPVGAGNWLLTATTAEACCEESKLQHCTRGSNAVDHNGCTVDQRPFGERQDQKTRKRNSSSVQLEASRDESGKRHHGSARWSRCPDRRSAGNGDDDSISEDHPIKRRSRRKWSKADDEKLVKLVTKGERWGKIFPKFPSRSQASVSSRWHVVLKPEREDL